MTAKQSQVYYCDEPGCTEVHIGRPTTWWLSRKDHRCDAHRPTCTRCGARLRNQSKTVSEAPNTLRVGTNGRCDSCSQEIRRAQNVDTIDEVTPHQIRLIRRLITDRFDDPNDRLVALETLGIGDEL